MSVFVKNGFFCIVNAEQNEVDDHFTHRGYLIVSSKPSSDEELKKISMISMYAKYIKYFGCKYNEQIHTLCKKAEEKIMIK